MKDKKPVIVCGGSRGSAVIFGWVDEIPEPEQPVTIHNARMVLYWPVPVGLFGLAQNGPPAETRMTCAVKTVQDTCRQVLAVTPVAAKRLDKYEVYNG